METPSLAEGDDDAIARMLTLVELALIAPIPESAIAISEVEDDLALHAFLPRDAFFTADLPERIAAKLEERSAEVRRATEHPHERTVALALVRNFDVYGATLYRPGPRGQTKVLACKVGFTRKGWAEARYDEDAKLLAVRDGDDALFYGVVYALEEEADDGVVGCATPMYFRPFFAPGGGGAEEEEGEDALIRTSASREGGGLALHPRGDAFVQLIPAPTGAKVGRAWKCAGWVGGAGTPSRSYRVGTVYYLDTAIDLGPETKDELLLDGWRFENATPLRFGPFTLPAEGDDGRMRALTPTTSPSDLTAFGRSSAISRAMTPIVVRSGPERTPSAHLNAIYVPIRAGDRLVVHEPVG